MRLAEVEAGGKPGGTLHSLGCRVHHASSCSDYYTTVRILNICSFRF